MMLYSIFYVPYVRTHILARTPKKESNQSGTNESVQYERPTSECVECGMVCSSGSQSNVTETTRPRQQEEYNNNSITSLEGAQP